MQLSFKEQLTEFEQATVEQLVSYRIAKKDGETGESVNARIEAMCSSDKLKAEAMVLVAKRNRIRKEKGLKPYS